MIVKYIILLLGFRMATAFEILKRNFSLQEREADVIRQFRKDPHPDIPARWVASEPLENSSEEELKTQMKDR